MIDKDLIDKFYKGECTEAEVRRVLGWFDRQHEGEKQIEYLWNSYSAEENPPRNDTDKILTTIHQRTGVEERYPQQYHLFLTQWLRVAGILVFAFILPLLIIKNESAPNAYAEVKQYVTKENPSGSKSTIYLPDGSVVKLNAESSITYLEGFTDSIRQVLLVGEAFFEVAENKKKPFIVSAAGVDTRALGTSFNVKAYEEDEHVQVVLASGKVKISMPLEKNSEEVLLVPGEGVWVEKNTRAMLKQQADLHAALAWKDDLLLFHQASADQIFTTLERWYGVEITFPEKFSRNSWRFSGEFQNENLENVLESISYVKNFKYQINQKSIMITL
ncbi:FecR family protein [Catalinimonas niigatensis]|uniref:FecR family protein n=1 Tax=Catalinimonas niigatensis TaxID=1397264 RepID=UPI00266522E9|nr:FecR domain-containing protein [Catalinimonas niigatensis]WPP51789.1 DUF4974 domain-containing protein [Catalinimonas niigatensis]